MKARKLAEIVIVLQAQEQAKTYQVMIGNNKFPDLLDYNGNQLVSPKIYNVWYFWTKEGCNIQ